MGEAKFVICLIKVEFKSLISTNGGRSTSRWRPRRFQGRIRRQRKRSRSRTWSWSRTRSRSWRQGGKRAVDSRHQVGSPRERSKDQVSGGDLPLLSSHQGMRNHRLFPRV